MNLIKQAINYAEETWNSLKLGIKISNFYTSKNVEYDNDILNCENHILKNLKEGDISAAYRVYSNMLSYKECKKELESFKKYLEEEHDN